MSSKSRMFQNDQAYEVGKSYDPVSELMRAIILRAIEDYNSEGELKKEAIDYMFDRTGDKIYYENEDDQYIFSFSSICQHLELDPEKTRNAIMNATHRISTRRRTVQK